MSSGKAVSFMAKKSWHTGTMKHMEKVWKAEQVAKKETERMAEWKREREEEREIEGLRRRHEQTSGLKRNERVDFIYQAPINSGPSAEDYLTGTRWKEDKQETDLEQVKDKPGSLWLKDNANSNIDKLQKIREDPMFAIRKEQQAQRERIKDNPVMMKKLRQELKSKKKQKKEKRRKRKSKNKSSLKRQRSRSSSPHKYIRKSRRSKNSESPENSDRRDYRKDDRREHRDRRDRGDRDLRDRDYRDRRDRDNRDNRDRRDRDYRERRGYRSSRRDKYEDEGRSQNRSRPERKRSNKLTEEEIQRKREEMMGLATVKQEERKEAILRKKQLDDIEEELNKKKIEDKGQLPKFISDFGNEVVNSDITGSVSDRVKRNINNIQRRGLDERGMF
eukprot:TRINITY_DN4967_c0_g1_i1.p1 TRINITY_DN4967_c0_g1~~TRINITY_DN4967_c0_g1_i1.p1  ORF type:complete len:390 (+),score=115.82 TRINITY_DN4967_c0_g1_i1:58-1227(+)